MSYSSSLTGRAPHQRRSVPVIIVGALILFLILSMLRWLQMRGVSGAPAASVVVLRGTASVWTLDDGEGAMLPMGATKPLQRGDEVRTGAQSKASLGFAGGDVVELDERTRMSVLRLYTTPIIQGPVAALGLQEGKALVRSRNILLGTTRFEVDTLVATMEGQGATFLCEVIDKASVRVLVYEGLVRVSMGEQAVDVQAGQSLEAYLGQALAPVDVPISAPPPEETLPPPGANSTPTLTDLEKTLFPPVVTPTLPGEGAEIYTVQQGDTLYSIAARYNLSWRVLFEANRDTLSSPETIRAGQTLRIPEP